MGGSRPVDGAPCLPSWNAFIRAAISPVYAPARPLLEKVGTGCGRRAALRLPRGVEDDVMPAVVALAAFADIERSASRTGRSGAVLWSSVGSEAPEEAGEARGGEFTAESGEVGEAGSDISSSWAIPSA